MRQEQAAILLTTTYLFAALGSGSATLFSIAFDGWASGPIAIAYSAVLGSYIAMILNGLRWRRKQNHVAFIKSTVFLLFLLGIAWGALVNLFALGARLDQQGTLIGLVMALVSAPMLGVPLSAALAFFLPISIACSIVIVFLITPIEYVAVLSFLGFLVFAITGFVSMNKTIMDRLVARLKLQREHEIVRVFLREYEEVSSDWLWESDANHRLRNVAPQLVEALNTTATRLENLDLFRIARTDIAGSEGESVAEAMRNGTAFRDRQIAVRGTDGPRWLNVTGHPVHDDKGVFLGYRGIGSDITAAYLNRQQIEFMARHDGLTRLLNRPAFVSETDAVLSRQPNQSHALMLIDLDDFKQVNDDLGHASGDALLKTVAARLREHLQPSEVAARIGGDEFAVLIRVQDQPSAAARAASLCVALQIEGGAPNSSLPTSASIGVAISPTHGTRLDQLMRRADFALYEAKNQGKGAPCFFEMRMENAFLSRQRLLSELATALDQGQIFAEYQPIADVSSGQIVSAEALVRWAHPTRGKLAAGSFVLAAEGSDLIEPLGARMLKLACRAAGTWQTRIPVSVNLSPRQLRSGRFVPILTECLAETGLPPHRLILEVTETVFLDTPSRIIQQLDLIRAMGVRLVLDDFGTGYSSLTYLRRFDVDGIKIDASFVRDLPHSRKVGAIVRTIGRLASDMNIYVTAEGVETEEQLRWLRGNGIAFAQGFLLGRPADDPFVAMTSAARERRQAPARPLEHGPA
ncbi:EAL domain-containing protein [Acetobacteraceae bacterium KSS8]|uniref:EAL domain-containing protein n=1 Tax=Endosaccharibacter trunci TaxID=2812733 RepID=A0ABT1W5C1_9PROT|nr:EAL domain-containing protein [Acetobacteraceae bacterium KSS8]